MKPHHVVYLLLLLQLWQNTVLSISSTSCPSQCQCFSTTTVICSDLLMKALPVNIPANATALIVLASGLRKITSLGDLKNLTKLVFLSNPVQNISHNAFEGLTSLQELEISGTFLLALEAGLFNKLDKLTKLLLNNNHKIKILAPNLFESLEKLEVLQLHGNMLQNLHKALFLKLTNLHELNLSSNQLSTVDTSRLSKLKKLDLGLNQITDLSLDTFKGNLQLQILSLQGNMISKLDPGIFSHLDNLEEVNLRDNKLEVLSSGLFPSNLKNLMLKGNSLLQLSSSAFTNLHNLIYLDLSQNLLSSLPAELFQNLSSLERLDLSGNRLQELSSTVFRGLFQISVIDLQKNNLTSLEADVFTDQGNMSRLILAGNQLENLPFGIFETLDFECLLQLRSNPWRCDCNLVYFHEWLYYLSNTVQDLSQVYCTEPQPLRGMSLTTVNKEQLVCINRTISEIEPTINQATSIDSNRQCSLQEADGDIVIRCELMTCTDLKLDVCFHQEDGSVLNYTVTEPWPGSSQCSNGTVILTV
ncbi:carboxypeptidase N subunit 2 [Hemibagrus wyckioides]|uniref:carboxypeptidase N subunit 2 n=1 Tax=Hemibagrus wyckioides TaxID=337641 RepID=UPI00266D1604|nr:carboxypeptidase N subunit 2 [Hemibagrus wyckioides]XP_058250057.1 carboxypeptidase N subunit 2 [Hemibagrus wyckioides]